MGLQTLSPCPCSPGLITAEGAAALLGDLPPERGRRHWKCRLGVMARKGAEGARDHRKSCLGSCQQPSLFP